MKRPLTSIIFIFLSRMICAQADPVQQYLSHNFNCEGVLALEITYCADTKYRYADSLLNDYYQTILLSVDQKIRARKAELLADESKHRANAETRENIEFLKAEIDHNQRLKVSLIKSQHEWIRLRDANSEVTGINCEGGRDCNSTCILSEIDDILDRIKKLRSFR